MNTARKLRKGIAAVVLAAGRSARMAGANKLTAPVDGKPMVRHAVEAALAAGAEPVVVVTGHDVHAVRAALAGLPVRFVHNPRFGGGLSTSVVAGIGTLPDSARAALVLLGDMPRVTAAHVSRVIAAFEAKPADDAIYVPVFGGQRGNPVLWGRRHFAAMQALTGDAGARVLVAVHAEAVREIEMEDDGVLFDIDTPDALRAAVDR